MARKTQLRLALSSLVIVSLVLGLWRWRQGVVSKHEKIASQSIDSGIQAGDFVAARSALQGIADEKARLSRERDIRIAELHKALSVRDAGLAAMAIGRDGDSWIDPDLLESADLVSAREALQTNDPDSAANLAEKWATRSKNPVQWKFLQIDALLARKKPEDALNLLTESSFTGRDEAMRQARLALLQSKEPWKAMTHLDEGLKADPQNADLLSFRAQIQEAAGRLSDARLDYVAAVLSDRKNPLYRDILANFHLRHGDPAAAAETWRDAAQDTGFGVYALKAWFWSRISGIPLSKPVPPSTQRDWAELVSALSNTTSDSLWSAQLEVAATNVRGASARPEIIWLKLLDAIHKGDCATAITTLDRGFPKEADRLCPDLALRLLTALNAQSGINPRLALAGRSVSLTSATGHPFVASYNQWAKKSMESAQADQFASWLAKPESTVGILFASGWAGAATTIGKGASLKVSLPLPDWFDYGYAKSLLTSHGKNDALAWLLSLPSLTPAASLLRAEIQLTSGAVDQGLALLKELSQQDSPLASRATWTLAMAALDQGKPAEARSIVLSCSTLAPTTQGREILARASLAEGQRAETIKIYQELGTSSPDAMIFLSKEAFAAGDFKQAQSWTAELARRFPDEPRFRQNLLKIEEAIRSKKP